jgi:hypothetical protein
MGRIAAQNLTVAQHHNSVVLYGACGEVRMPETLHLIHLATPMLGSSVSGRQRYSDCLLGSEMAELPAARAPRRTNSTAITLVTDQPRRTSHLMNNLHPAQYSEAVCVRRGIQCR